MVSRGQILGILSFAYTSESGRRYGRDDPALGEEIALHAAHAFENARLMKDLKASEERFRVLFDHLPIGIVEYDYRPTASWFEQLRAAGIKDLSEWLRAHPEALRSGAGRVKIVEAAGTARGVHPEARQPPQVDREEHDQHEPQPEGRHVAHHERHAHGGPVDRGLRPPGGA